MFNIPTLTTGLFAAGLLLAPLPASAAPIGPSAVAQAPAPVEAVQYGYYGGPRFGPRFGGGRRVYGGPRYGGRGYGYGRGYYGRGYGYGRPYGYGRRSYF